MFTQHRHGGGDPYWSDVILLLHGEGTNGGAVITDSSLYAHTGTVVGGLTTSTSQFKYGSSSLLFDATGGSYVEYTANSEWLFGSSDFTIEAWVRPTSVDATRRSLFDFRFDGSGSGTAYAVDFTSSQLRFEVGAGSNLPSATSATTLTINTWQHIACVRDGTTIRVYKDGTQLSTATGVSGSLNDKSATAKVRVGRRNDGTQNFGGNMDEVRFTRNVCRYPGGTTFAPPSAAFQDN